MSYSARISEARLTIYDSVRESDNLFFPIAELERTLRNGLLGLDLNYPLRTRSKVLKSRVCEILGYPIPKSFKKTRPRFPGQDFDTYVQKSNNLQVWNEEIVPSRRYVIVKVDENSVVTAVRVVTGETLSRLDTTGTMTQKFQAKSKLPVNASRLVTTSDPYGLVEKFREFSQSSTAKMGRADLSGFLPIAELYASLLRLMGTTVPDPGLDQERNRGGAIHTAVCEALGMAYARDTGACPDIVEQLLEIKLQTSPTIDLGLVSPDDESPLGYVSGIRHCDVRYAVFYGVSDGERVRIQHLVLCSGRDFFEFFQRFEGKVINAKLQIPLPSDFFD
jgi:hypothetical protein